MAKVLISDKLSGLQLIFSKKKIEASYQSINKEEILKIIHEYDGLAIRSATKVLVIF